MSLRRARAQPYALGDFDMGYAGDRNHNEAILQHKVRLDRTRLRITLPMNAWVFRLWLFVIAWNVFIPALVLGVRFSAPPFLLYLAPLIWVGAAYFAVRAWKNATVFAFGGETFSATFGPLPPSTTAFTMPTSDIVSFDAEYDDEDHGQGFVLKALNQAGERITIPARLHGVVLKMGTAQKQVAVTGKPDDALVIALAKELNRMLAESRERQRSFRK